jgi:AraC family ethanolamine operon transcriptional activator
MVSLASQRLAIDQIVLDFFDPDAMEEAVQRSHFEHSLDCPGEFRGTVVQARNAHTRLDWGRYNLPVIARGPFAPDRMTFGGLLNEQGNSLANGLVLPPGSMLLFREGEELNTRLSPNSNWLTIQLDRQRLAKIGIEPSDRGVEAWKPDVDSNRLLRTKILTSMRFIESTTRHAREADLLAANQSINDVEDYVLFVLARLVRAKRIYPVFAPLRGKEEALRIVRDATNYMQANIDSPITIAEICTALPTNIKALERAFLHTYGIGPKQYLLRYRLSNLRRMLLRASGGAGFLTEAYLACGLPHFSRTAQRYKDLFGELPSLTLSQSNSKRTASA